MDTFCGYPVQTHHVELDGRTFELIAPASADALLDDPRTQMRFQENEYIPYWATLWPGARMLALAIARRPRPDSAAPRRVIEIGCGLGLTGLAAAVHGDRVTLSDYDADALAFARENARRNGVFNVEFMHLDWTQLAPAGCFDVVLAADALYEARNHGPVARCIAALLDEGGLGLLSDPGRSIADAFPEAARAAGLTCIEQPAPPLADTAIIRARIFEVRRVQPQHAI